MSLGLGGTSNFFSQHRELEQGRRMGSPCTFPRERGRGWRPAQVLLGQGGGAGSPPRAPGPPRPSDAVLLTQLVLRFGGVPMARDRSHAQ